MHGPTRVQPSRCMIMNSRWIGLAVGILVESIGGLFYMFGVYSDDLKTRSWGGGGGLNSTLTQAQLEMVVTASNVRCTPPPPPPPPSPLSSTHSSPSNAPL